MEITLLGTGTSQGVPMIGCKCEVCTSTDIHDNRLRSSAMVKVNGKTIIIDAGPDFRQQMLREKVNDIHAILLTHEHKDHTGGLDDIRPFNFRNRHSIDIYCEELVQNTIKSDYSYAFGDDRYPGVPQMNLHTIDENPFFIGDIKIIPIRVLHMNLPILGFRINDFTYITDASFISEMEIEKLKGTHTLIVNAVRKRKHYSHFNVRDALDLIKRVKPQQAYFTHISHSLGKYSEVNKELPEHVALGYDGLKILL